MATPSDDHGGRARMSVDLDAHCVRCAGAWTIRINSMTRAVSGVRIWDDKGELVLDETADSMREKFLEEEERLHREKEETQATFQSIVDDVLGDVARIDPDKIKKEDDGA